MERRSRSTSRPMGQVSRASADERGRSFPDKMPAGLLYRAGGDSRTLSPERKGPFPKTSPHHSMNKSGSYNVYTQGQPPPIPPPLQHAASAMALGAGPNPVPPPRAPVNNLRKQQGGERIVWEYHQVLLERVPGYGFGIAVSGGRDNPHFTNGDPSIAISDVLKSGPAEGKLLINDRVISANNISLEGVDYATAVQVLRDSGQSVSLVVKRRLVLPPSVNGNSHTSAAVMTSSPNSSKSAEITKRVTLCKSNKKKDDFGLILGCKIYIKEILNQSLADKETNLSEGDFVNSINGISLDGMSLKEARKLLDTVKEKLELVITNFQQPVSSLTSSLPAEEVKDLQPEHNQQQIEPFEQEANDMQSPRKEDPVLITTTSALSTPSTVAVQQTEHFDFTNQTEPNGEYGLTKRQSRSEDDSRSSGPMPDPRFISFQKSGSVGIRLTGGNEVGIFVTAVQPGSPAAQQGLQPGDKILKVNDLDMKSITREEAVLFLLSLQDQINLIAQYRRDEYDQIVSLQRGDSFYIKAHFSYEAPDKAEMAFTKSDVFHVVDTLHNGVVGSWQAFRMDPFLSGLGRAAEQVQKGVIPNKTRAEEIATMQFNLAKKEQSSAEQSRGTSFFRRRKEKNGYHRRSKSLGKDHWEDLVWSESMSKFPAYERVSLRHPGFPRPVVIFGPIADMARERLLRDFPGKFASPQQALDLKSNNKSGIVRLTAIREIMSKGKHALLDVTPNAVDKLNYAQFYPIVIFARADSKQTIKECRSGAPKKAHMPSKKLLEQCQKLEKLWSHVFTATITLANITAENQWYNKLTDLIDKQQTAPIWMSDAKPDESVADDFLFPMSSGISYNSSAESDGEFCGEAETPRNMSRQPSEEPNLSRFNSDPNLANMDHADPSMMSQPKSPPSSPEKTDATNTSRRSQVSDSKYGFNHHQNTEDQPPPPHPQQRSYNSPPKSSNGLNGPSIPPKIERHKKPSKLSPTSKHNSLERPSGQLKMSVYDAYDPYNDTRYKRPPPPQNGPPVPPTEPVGYRSSASLHDPGYRAPGSLMDNGYRSAASMHDPGYRSLQQNGYASRYPPANDMLNGGSSRYAEMPPSNGYPDSIPRYPGDMGNGYAESRYAETANGARYPDYKPVPPPKSAPYKPVPPPKPKSSNESNYMNNGGLHYHSSNLKGGGSMFRYSNGDNNDVDSGQGSSLDRDYGLYNNNNNSNPGNNSKGGPQYYYNLPQHQNGGNATNTPPRREVGLDLTNNREYRGSAFELYKKPLSEARPNPSHSPHQNQYYSNQTVAR